MGNVEIAVERRRNSKLLCHHLRAERAMGELHDRMPGILDEADWPKWLGEEPATPYELYAMLKPCPDEALKIWPVDNAVGNVRNKGPQLIRPINPPLFGELT
jgi:putative SOS response-associated peptidase YedK